MKRSLSFRASPADHRDRAGSGTALVVAGTSLIAGTYGLVRLAYGLLLPDISDSIPLTPAVAGYVASGASAAYCAGALVGLLAGGRARLLVVAALLTASLGALGMAVAPGLAAFAPAAVVASAGAGLASPGMVAVVARNVAAEQEPRAQAWVNSGTGPGLVAAGLLALLVPDWRLGFTISAALTAAAGAWVLLLDRPGSSGTTSDHDAPAGHDPEHDTRPGLRPWLAALRRPALAAFALGVGSGTVWTYGRAHVVDAGAGDTGSVLAWIALGAGGTATVLTAGALGALPAPRAWLLTATATAVATAALVAPGSLPVAAAACALFGWGFVAASSALIVWVSALSPSRASGGTSAVFITLVLGQAAGSSAAGRLGDLLGMPTAFALAAVATLLAATCGWRARAEALVPRAPGVTLR